MISNFTAPEMIALLKLAGITSSWRTVYGDQQVFNLTMGGDISILMAKSGGWYVASCNVPTKAVRGSDEYAKAFRWKLTGIRSEFPDSALEVKNYYNDDSVVSCLRFRVSITSDIEVLVETIKSMFVFIEANREEFAARECNIKV